MYDSGYSGEAYGLFFWLIIFGLWFYFGFAQYKIAKKIGHNSPWFSFIPILNFIQLIQLADKPLWWFFVCLIPVVNIVAIAWLWMETAKNCGKPPVWGFLMIIPVVNLLAVGVLGFTSGSYPVAPDSYSQPPAYEREQVS
jgi:quinol-cytochrome oxidoreductase complex cytochrome b subunit